MGRGPHGDRPAQYLVPVGVHGQHAEHVEGVLAVFQTTDRLRLDRVALTRIAVTRGGGQLLHADDTVLESKTARRKPPCSTSTG